mmetsp:Transcript_7258/g.13444  ORF Transcript_7258/g.13444 Transcript_7258/m.13444 type:complete len:165 (+) Transcript_7258:1324-1818(+)
MDPPQQLEFFSWWNEDQHRQHLRLSYDLTTKILRVRINDSDQEHVSPRVCTGSGKEAEIWDLYVGAEIEVFGKKTVLKQCNQKTADWLASQAHNFAEVKEQLEVALRKYDTSKLPYSILRTPVPCLQGSTSLRDYIMQIRWLKERLCGYRPRVANRITAHIKDL